MAVAFKKGLRKKILIVTFRLLLILILLEIGLRVSGSIHLLYQDFSNRAYSHESDFYGILTLGESMSYGGDAWPEQLDVILNNESNETKFRVFNKAFGGATSSAILLRLESYLDKYTPDMVIVMIGIMDEEEYILFESHGRISLLLEKLRLYRFGKFFFESLRIDGGKDGVVNDLDGSIEEGLKEAITLNPRNLSTYQELAIFYSKIKKYEQAEGVMKELISVNRTNINAYLDFLFLYYKQQKYGEAREIIDMIIEIEPSSADAYYWLGLIYKKNSSFEEAERMFKKSLEINPELGNVYFDLALMYLDWNKPQEAEKIFKVLMPDEQRRSYSKLYSGMGQRYINETKFPEATLEFKKAIIADPENEEGYLGLSAMYYYLHMIEDSNELLEKAIKLNPESITSYLILGNRYRDLKMFEKSLEMYNKVLDLTSSNVQDRWVLYNNLGEIYMELDMPNESITAFNKVVELEPKRMSAYTTLGDLYQEVGLIEESINMYQTVINENPNNFTAVNAYAGLAYIYISYNRSELAEEIFEELNPNLLIRVYNQVGGMHLDGGSQKEAEEIFDKIRLMRADYHSLIISDNYNRLFEMLAERGIRLVIMQYPTLEVSELKRNFQGDENIIFVENKKNFEDALVIREYQDFFVDRSHGTFGHPTFEGHKMMAGNVAATILKELEVG